MGQTQAEYIRRLEDALFEVADAIRATELLKFTEGTVMTMSDAIDAVLSRREQQQTSYSDDSLP